MNLLAHLWLADRSRTSPAGQILGDIIKGRPETFDFGTAINHGIRLHRRIDSVCDDHPAHRELRRRFQPPFRRYAGIIVDIGLDHALARRWHEFSSESLSIFAERIAAQVANDWPMNTPHRAPPPMDLSQLLRGYTDAAGIQRALSSVEYRLRRANPLGEALPALLDEYAGFHAGISEILDQLIAVVNEA